MAVTIRVPTTLRPLTAGLAEVQVEGMNVAELISSLESKFSGFSDRVLDENGELRRFVNIFVDDEDIRFIDGLATAVADGITVAIVPAVAGG